MVELEVEREATMKKDKELSALNEEKQANLATIE
jgi:hypothetical protein